MNKGSQSGIVPVTQRFGMMQIQIDNEIQIETLPNENNTEAETASILENEQILNPQNFNQYLRPFSTNRRTIRTEIRLNEADKIEGDKIRQRMKRILKKSLFTKMNLYKDSNNDDLRFENLKNEILNFNLNFWIDQTNPGLIRKNYNSNLQLRDSFNEELIDLQNQFQNRNFPFLF